MEISHVASSPPALQQALRTAMLRWMTLCEITARAEGVDDEELQQELQWLHTRMERLIARDVPVHMRQVIADIERAEVWVYAGLNASLHTQFEQLKGVGSGTQVTEPGTER